MAKIPMQFFILFIGAMVFVFFLFEQPPILFQQAELKRIEGSPGLGPVSESYSRAFEQRKQAALAMVEAKRAGDGKREDALTADYRAAQREMDAARGQAFQLVERTGGEQGFRDTNYNFLSFVTRYLPAGIVGLVIAVIIAAAMSASSGEINSLATVLMVDIYKRHVRRNGSDRHYLWASRLATLFWGGYAVAFAGWGKTLGSLIEAVNVVGSLFYSSLLGVFALAFFFPRVGGTAAFIGMLAAEAAIFSAFKFTNVSWLWYNVIGCAAVIGAALLVTAVFPPKRV
jgi:Na+(H+)/acetate symporter ActP